MNNKELNGLFIADIHIGAMSIDQTKIEINFLKEYIENKYFDYIIIGGDFWDRKIYTYEEYIRIGMNLMLTMLDHCDKLRIVHGTKSHDNNQFNIFEPFLEKYDFKIIYTVEEEELFDGVNVLYIPEEYVYSKNEYYHDFFERKYSYVFGHGVISEAMSNAIKSMKKDTQTRKKAPVFTCGELSSICDYATYFGHYHIHTDVNEKVFYSGSYSRYEFGQEEPKGFFEIHYKNGISSHEMIINESTRNYITILFGYNHSIFNPETDLLDELKKIKKKKEISGTDKLRLKFNIPEDYENSEYFIKLVNNVFQSDDDIKVEITNGYIANKKAVSKEKFKEVKERFGYIFEDNAVEEKLRLFIKEKYNKDISIEKMKKYINGNALELLNTDE